jgi:hypothetical protein
VFRVGHPLQKYQAVTNQLQQRLEELLIVCHVFFVLNPLYVRFHDTSIPQDLTLVVESVANSMPQTFVRPHELRRDLGDMGISIAQDVIFPFNFQTTLGCRFDVACSDGQWDVGGLKELLTS